ncbi:MAG: hypothetical protein WBG08_06890 [Litorimonas sp.]
MERRITSLRETGVRDLPSTGRFEPVSDYFLVDESQDLRGRTVLEADKPGELTVRDMLVDPDTQRVAIVELSDGRRMPIEHVRLRGSYVSLEG